MTLPSAPSSPQESAVQARGFSISFDAKVNLIRVKRWGFWNVEDARAYRVALKVEIAKRSSAGPPLNLLIDIEAADTLAREPALKMAAVAADLEASSVRRIAYVGQGALKKMQVRRIVGSADRFRTFDTEGEAIAWLTSG